MPDQYSRRSFLAGVLACGTVSASASYLLLGPDAEGGRTPEPTPSASAPPPPGVIELRVATGQDAIGARQLLFDMWNMANPGVQVRPYRIDSGTSDERTVMLELARLGQADVVNLDVIHIPEFARKELITPITLLNSADFLESTRRPSEVANDPGKFWAAPFNTDVGMLFQRLPGGGRAGTEPSLSDVIDGVADRSGDFVGQLRPTSSASDEAFVINVLEHAIAVEDTILSPDGTISFDLGLWRKALGPLQRALAAGRITSTATEDESVAQFDSGNRRYMRNWPTRFRQLRPANPAGPDREVRVGPLPVGILGGQSLALVARSEATPAAVYDVRAAHALRVINFLTDVPAQMILATHGWAPTRIKPYSDPTLNRLIPHIQAMRDAVEKARPRPRPLRQEYVKFSDVVRRHAFAYLHQGKELPPAFVTEMKAALS
ncbi:MAG TPA: ABC transporter-binding protein [Pilimelia sp.]|nr:ABC transporter-binding protein [Pilimelia sp.]